MAVRDIFLLGNLGKAVFGKSTSYIRSHAVVDLAQSVGSPGKVYGIDISEGMFNGIKVV